jgi:hypothetical protein
MLGAPDGRGRVRVAQLPATHDATRPAALQASLRTITEILAHELARPSLAVPDWSAVEWRLARAVAAMHGVAPLLCRDLRWCGPADWVMFLAQQRAHTESRHTRVAALLQQLDQLTRAQGVVAVALKGAALHALGLYAAGERPMADVDLLVQPQDAQRTARLIESLGFQQTSASWKERVFTPSVDPFAAELGEHASNSIKIELHERICERLPWRTTDVSNLIFPARAPPGLNGYPSKAALMLHLLLHAAGAMAFKSLRLLHLHDLALLCSRMLATDWSELLQCRSRAHPLWWALPPLHVMARYFPSSIPANALAALSGDCPWLLFSVSRRRTLSEVSLSHLWVDAFPGIEWSQSAAEMLRYVVGRIRPDPQHLALRQTTATTQAWTSGSPWSTLPQGRRILRWISARQPRPATMHVVRAALASPTMSAEV